MVFRLFIIHNRDRMSSIIRVQILHTTTWDYFTSHLPDRFIRSSKVVKEAIMTDIKDSMQELHRNSSDVVTRASFFEMRCLLKILQGCFDFEVCFYIIQVAVLRLADMNLQTANPNSWNYSAQSGLDKAKFGAESKILFGYRKIFDQSLCNSKDLGDMLRFLPGVVVLNRVSMQGMVDLYRIKPDLLERFIEFTMEPLNPSPSHYALDDYLSDFLRDRTRSKCYYCNPMLQHISICRHILSSLDGSNAIDLQS